MPGSFDNDAGEALFNNGVRRLHKLFQYTFASHDPSAKIYRLLLSEEQVPPMPEQFAIVAQNVSLASVTGLAAGSLSQWWVERTTAPLGGGTKKTVTAHAARTIAEEQTQRLLRIMNASLLNSIRFTGFAALFFGGQLLSQVYRASDDGYNMIVGGLASGAAFGLFLARGSMVNRLRGTILGAAAGGCLAAPVGLLQDAVDNMLPEEEKVKKQQRLDRLFRLLENSGEC